MDSNNAHLNIASISHSKNNTNYSWQKIALLFNLSVPLEHVVPVRYKRLKGLNNFKSSVLFNKSLTFLTVSLLDGVKVCFTVDVLY